MPESRERRFALILQAIQDEENDRADYMASHKARMETLRQELHKLKMETLSGQLQLVTEPVETPRITESEEVAASRRLSVVLNPKELEVNPYLN